LALAVSTPVDSLPPEGALSPDQLPEAVQEVAFVEDQVRVEDAPLAIVCGLAVIVTVGIADVSPLPPDCPQPLFDNTANHANDAQDAHVQHFA